MEAVVEAPCPALPSTAQPPVDCDGRDRRVSRAMSRAVSRAVSRAEPRRRRNGGVRACCCCSDCQHQISFPFLAFFLFHSSTSLFSSSPIIFQTLRPHFAHTLKVMVDFHVFGAFLHLSDPPPTPCNPQQCPHAPCPMPDAPRRSISV